jgi:HAE1 family hydrophobic/amphiphilic exporter-1
MTTIAMIAGMIPVAVARGDGAETRVPMALVIIGGLITSTVLTLVVVPVVYSLLDGLTQRLKRSKGGKGHGVVLGTDDERAANDPALPGHVAATTRLEGA